MLRKSLRVRGAIGWRCSDARADRCGFGLPMSDRKPQSALGRPKPHLFVSSRTSATLSPHAPGGIFSARQCVSSKRIVVRRMCGEDDEIFNPSSWMRWDGVGGGFFHLPIPDRYSMQIGNTLDFFKRILIIGTNRRYSTFY